MGNEISGEDAGSSPPPAMVLTLDAFSIPYAARVFQRQHSMEPESEAVADEVPSPHLSPRCADGLEPTSEFWCTRVLLDGDDIPGGAVYNYPSNAITIAAGAWSSQLQLQFFSTPTELTPRALISISLQKLIGFGAPLYTSLWLGLKNNGVHADDNDLSEALARAYEPDTAKIKITIFRPAGNYLEHGIPAEIFQPDIKGLLEDDTGCDACLGPDACSKTATSKPNQIEGLINCLSETNALIREHHEAVMLKPVKEKLTRDLQRAKTMLAEAQEKRSIDIKNHAAMTEKLQQELSDIRARNASMILDLREQQALELQAKKEEVLANKDKYEEELSNIHSQQLAQLGKIRAQLDEKTTDATSQESLRVARSQWEADSKSQLAQTLSAWTEKVQQKSTELEAQLLNERAKYDSENASLKSQVDLLIEDINSANADIEQFSLMRGDSATALVEMRSRFEQNHAAALADGKRRIEEQRRASQQVKQLQEHEMEQTKVRLQQFAQKLEEEIDAVKACHLKDAVDLAKQRQAQDSAYAVEFERRQSVLQAEYRTHLGNQHEQWEKACHEYEQQIAALQKELKEQSGNMDSLTTWAKDKREEIISLQAELPSLRDRSLVLGKTIPRLEQEANEKLATTRNEEQQAQIAYDQEVEELRRTNAVNLQSASEKHEAAATECNDECAMLRRELEALKVETQQQCEEISKSWELKLSALGDAFARACVGLNDAEEDGAKALEKLAHEGDQRLEALVLKRVGEAAEVEQKIANVTNAGKETQTQLSREICRVEEKGIQDEEVLAAEHKKLFEELESEKRSSLEGEEMELQKKLQDVQSERETILADQEQSHQGRLQNLAAEAAHLKESVATLAETRRENINLASELDIVRTRGADLGNARNDCAAEVSDATTTLETVRADLAATKKNLQDKETHLQKVLNELQDIRLLQERSVIEAEQDKQRLEEETIIEMNKLQRSIEDLQNNAPSRLSEELRNFESDHRPDLDNLQRRVEELQKQLLEQKMSLADSEKEQKSKVESQLKDVVVEKRDKLLELKVIRDQENAFRQEAEQRSRKQKREAESTYAAAQQQIEEEKRAQTKESKDELQRQEDKHVELLDHLKKDHEVERNRLRNLLPEQEKVVDALHDKIAAAEASKVALNVELESMTGDLDRFANEHEKQMQTCNAKHHEMIDKESESANSGHKRLQKQIDDKRELLSGQLTEIQKEAESANSELELFRSQIDSEVAEATGKDEHLHQQLANLNAQLNSVESELQEELAKAAHLVEIANLRIANHEQQAKTLSEEAMSASERVQMAIESMQVEIDETSVQIREAREETKRRGEEMEQYHIQELDNMSKRFQQETATQEMTHTSELEASSLAFDAALQAEEKEHLQKVQTIRTEISGLQQKIKSLEPSMQEFNVLRSQIALARERNEDMDASRRKSESQGVADREQAAASINQKHSIKLSLERESFENSLKQHNDTSAASLDALKDTVEATLKEFQQELAALEDQHKRLDKSGRDCVANLEKRRIEEFAAVGDAAKEQSEALQKELYSLRNSCEEIRIAEKALEVDVTKKTEAQILAVAKCLDERIENARSEAKLAVKSQFMEDKLIIEEELGQLKRDDHMRKTQAEHDMQQKRSAHEQQIMGIRSQAVRDSEVARAAHADLEKRTASTRSIGEQVQGTAEATQKAHELELQMCDEALRAALEDLTLQEQDAHRELLRELAETQRNSELAIRRARSECDMLADKVRQDAIYDADKRIESVGSKIKKEITKLQAGAADLHNRYDRANGILERWQKKEDVKKGNLRTMKDINDKPRGSITGGSGKSPTPGKAPSSGNLSGRGLQALKRSSSKALGGYSALESPIDRMVLEIFTILLLERCGTLNALEVDQRFETLRSGQANAAEDLVRVSCVDFSRAITRVLAARRQCNLAEAFNYVMAQVPKGHHFQGALRKTLALDEELLGHVCFLIDSALRQSRQAAGKYGAALDEPITEDEFVSMFSDGKLGQSE